MLKQFLVLFTLLAGIGLSSHAHAFRCASGKLVLAGDTSVEVKLNCGEPDMKEYVGLVERNGKYVNLVRYVYLPAKAKFIKIVEFHDGVVASISNGPRRK